MLVSFIIKKTMQWLSAETSVIMPKLVEGHTNPVLVKVNLV
jgi:hypothetical protein